jgi:hypothetical protein
MYPGATLWICKTVKSQERKKIKYFRKTPCHGYKTAYFRTKIRFKSYLESSSGFESVRYEFRQTLIIFVREKAVHLNKLTFGH